MYILSLFPVLVSSTFTRTINHNSIFILLSLLGNFIYVMAGTVYDYIMAKIKLERKTFYNNKIISYITSGIYYFFNTMSGVFATNRIWFFTRDLVDSRIYILLLTSLSTILFSSGWYILAKPTENSRFIIINSIFRSVLECLSFNSVAWATYTLWDYWTLIGENYYWVAIIVFTPLHLIVSYFVIGHEIFGNNNPLVYGIYYMVSFSSIAFSTNGVFTLITSYISNTVTLSIITVIGGILTTVLHPDIYRASSNPVHSNDNIIKMQNFNQLNRTQNVQITNINNRIRIWHVLNYYFLVMSFVVTSGIMYSYV